MRCRPALDLLFALLVGVCCCSCAARTVTFTSEPSAATVTFAARECVTPCTMPADCDAGPATFRQGTDTAVVTQVPPCQLSDTVRYEVFDKTEKAFKIIATPFAIVGVIGLAALGEDCEDSESSSPDLLLFTAGSLAAAGILYLCGEGFGQIKGDRDTEVHMVFPPESDASRAATRLPPALALPPALYLDQEGYNRLQR